MGLVLRGCAGVWRRAQDPDLRVVALALGCGTVGLAIVETTAAFTGADARFSTLFGFLVGLLAAAWRVTASAEPGVRPSVS